MTPSDPVQVDTDASSVRRAAQRIGWQITIAAAVVVAAIILIAVLFIIDQSQPRELIEKPSPGESKIYVDSQEVFVALIVAGIAAIVIAGILSWFFARRAVRPLGEALRIQRTFVADASHELRTPLAVLDARIQVLQRRIGPDSELAPDVDRLRRDVATLVGVVNDLLLAAAGETFDAEAASVDVGEIVAETVESMRVLSRAEGVEIQVDMQAEIPAGTSVETPSAPPSGPRANIPATSLRRCLVALLDNAVAHAPAESTVAVAVRRVKANVEIAVIDHGPGIKGIAPERIFDRFAHSTEAETPGRARSGFGIGLALVRDIVVRHHGSVELRQTPDGGATFVLLLPLSG